MANRWSRRAAQRELRDTIAELQVEMMSQTGNEADNTCRLAELMQNLQVRTTQAH